MLNIWTLKTIWNSRVYEPTVNLFKDRNIEYKFRGCNETVNSGLK